MNRTATTLLFFLLSGSSWAFSKQGHMATGAIAYETMWPQQRDLVVAILEHHPYVMTHWAAELGAAEPAGVSRAERLFMLAAAWPDEVRGDEGKKKYNRPRTSPSIFSRAERKRSKQTYHTHAFKIGRYFCAGGNGGVCGAV